FACCMAGDADGGELDLGTPKRARSRPTRSGRKVRVKKAVRTGGAARKMEDGTVVQSDGSKVGLSLPMCFQTHGRALPPWQ
ncbi:unnamed protein product, partial [Symbiodinium sp. KB8]